MKTFAVIQNNLVVNVIAAASQEIADECNPGLLCIEYTPENIVGIGWTYDGTDFTAPVTEEVTE